MAYKPVVAFDIDGVLANFSKHFVDLAVKLGLTEPFDTAGQPKWEFDFHVDPVWAEIDGSVSFWESCPTLLTPEDLDAMDALAQEATIVYCTARFGGKRVAEQTMAWLEANELPHGPLILPGTKASKAGVYIPMRHHLLGIIDDRPETLVELATEGLPIVARAWKYNEHVTGVPRVPSIAAFVDRLGVKVTTTHSGWQPGVNMLTDNSSSLARQEMDDQFESQ